jgi:hypothetical protein
MWCKNGMLRKGVSPIIYKSKWRKGGGMWCKNGMLRNVWFNYKL